MTKISLGGVVRVVIVAALSIATPTIATAAETDADISSGIATVVVTAQKRSQAMDTVGIPIAAFTSEQLHNAGVQSADGLAVITPGLTVTETAPTGVPVYTLRGVGFADFATSSSGTVGLYSDEVSIPYPVMSRGALFDLERVEVLKGPQGDLYGRNTTAGQINFIDAKPTRKRETGVTVDYSRFGNVDAEGYTSGAIKDGLLGRFSFKISKTLGDGGWQESISRPGDELGKKDAVALRGILKLLLSENADLQLKLHWNQDKSDNASPTAFDGRITGNPGAEFLPAAYSSAPYFSTGNPRATDWNPNFRPRRDSNLGGFSAKVNWDLTDSLNFASITAYDRFKRNDRFNTEGVPFEAGDTDNGSYIRAFSQEFRVASREGASPVSWITGLYYSHDNLSEQYDFHFKDSFYGVALGINNIATHYDQKTTSTAAFGHLEWKFIDPFKLVLGARYTEEKRKWSGCTRDSGDGSLAGAWNNILTPFTIVANGLPDPGLAVAGGCSIYNDIAGTANYGKFGAFSDDISAGKWQWKAGLDYSPSKNVLLYTSVSEGFKSGGFNGASAQTHSQLKPYKLESLTSFELGLKSNWLNRHLLLNASLFNYDYRDKQEQTIAVTPVGNISGLTNVPKSRIQGVELELHALVTSRLTTDFSVAYLDTRILQYQAIDLTSVYPTIVTFDASGRHLPNAPRWQATATVTYEWPLDNSMKMMVAGDVNYKLNTEGSPQEMVSGYTLFNARIGISDASNKWSAMLYGRNIFNQYYWTAAYAGNTTYARANGMAATYGVMFTYKM